MVARQRELGAKGGVVMEGRDIGTKVFPDAEVKIFLEADPAVRVERRMKQRETAPDQAPRIAAELLERDRRDSTRATSPLVPAEDAVIVDSTHLTIDDVVARAEELVKRALASGSSL
jgi:cytidylate kinase